MAAVSDDTAALLILQLIIRPLHDLTDTYLTCSGVSNCLSFHATAFLLLLFRFF